MSTRQQQDLMPTTIAILSDIEASQSLIQTPAKRSNRNDSIQTSGSKTTIPPFLITGRLKIFSN
eukprot:3644892-Amphidinium_carterae.1